MFDSSDILLRPELWAHTAYCLSCDVQRLRAKRHAGLPKLGNAFFDNPEPNSGR